MPDWDPTLQTNIGQTPPTRVPGRSGSDANEAQVPEARPDGVPPVPPEPFDPENREHLARLDRQPEQHPRRGPDEPYTWFDTCG